MSYVEWNSEEFDNVTSRIEKINMQFSKLLEEMNTSTVSTSTPTGLKISLGEFENPIKKEEVNVVNTPTNYYANKIEKNRQVKGVPKHAITLDLSEYDRKIIDAQLEKLYSTKKSQESLNVYNIKEICDNNKTNMVIIDYSTIPVEKSLVVKRSWKDILFSDIDLNKQIDVWGAVKRFCNKQINIKFM